MLGAERNGVKGRGEKMVEKWGLKGIESGTRGK